MKTKLKISEFFTNSELNTNITFKIDTKCKNQVYIDPVLNYISTHQNSAYQILSIANENQIDIEQISLLIKNLFPNNIYSTSSINIEYLILLTRCLLDEINKIKSKNDFKNFLTEKNATFYLLKQLYVREDIIEYFKQILHSPLTYIDYTERKNKFVFDFDNLSEKLEQIEKRKFEEKELAQHKNKSEKIKKKKSFIQSLIRSNSEISRSTQMSLNECEENNVVLEYFLESLPINNDQDNHISIPLTLPQFMTEYVPDKNESDFDCLISQEKNENIKEYLQTIKNEVLQNKELYSNDSLYGEIFKHVSPEKIFALYARNFSIVIRLIEEIILQLVKNIDQIPTIIRFLCKIIELALKKKFKDIKEYELIPFLGQILFEVIMKPIFFKPHYFGLIGSPSLLEETLYNIEMVYKVMKKFYQCELFNSNEDSSFTFFNTFFMKNISIIMNLFSKILATTRLPNIIEKFIDPEKYNFSPNNYVINYFEYNQADYQNEKCCLYSKKQIAELLKVVTDNLNIVFDENEKAFKTVSKAIECLNRNMNDFTQSNLYEQESMHIFQLKEKLPLYNSMLDFFQNKIHSKPECSENDKILQAKKDLCACLNNIIDLSQCSAIKTELLNTNKLLTMLEIIASFASNNLCNSSHLHWEIQSLKENILTFPEKYKNNDYSLFYSEIEKDLHESMKHMNIYFSIIANYRENIRFLRKEFEVSQNLLQSLEKERLTKDVYTFIETKNIRVTVGIVKQKNSTKLIIKDKSNNKKSKYTIALTIKEFYEAFPDLNKYIDNDNSIFNLIQEVNLRQLMKDYFKLVENAVMSKFDGENAKQFEKVPTSCNSSTISNVVNLIDSFSLDETLKGNPKSCNEEPTELYFNQVKNCIMENLYIKIFPYVQSENDIRFYENCLALSDLSISTIVQNSEFNCSEAISKAIQNVHRFEKAYSPNEKGLQLRLLIKNIKDKLQYLKGGLLELDEYLPYIWLSIIKAKPKYFYSNIEYLTFWSFNEFEFECTTINSITNQIESFMKDTELNEESINDIQLSHSVGAPSINSIRESLLKAKITERNKSNVFT